MLRRLRVALSWTGILVATASLGFWAGTNAIAPPRLPVEEHAQQTYAVEIGTVGRSVRLAVTASWPRTRTLFAGGDGVVTSIRHRAGDLASPGDILLTIGLEPLVVAQGVVPMFRSLTQGSAGADVAQFQELLRSLRHLDGPADGRFGPATASATRRWQRSIGAEPDGVVDAGALLFVEHLPVRMEVQAAVGQRVTSGSDLVRVLGERPEFTAMVTSSQRAELTSGQGVTVQAPDGTVWKGELGTFEQLGDGRFQAAVTGTLCGEGCGLVAVDDETALAGSVELVPDTRGVVVPTSALTQQPAGGLAVTLVDGTTRGVRVAAEADGFAVVEGIAPGVAVRLPSAPAP